MTKYNITIYIISTIVLIYAASITHPAYLQVRRNVIEWSLNQPEMDVYTAEKLNREALADAKQQYEDTKLPVNKR